MLVLGLQDTNTPRMSQMSLFLTEEQQTDFSSPDSSISMAAWCRHEGLRLSPDLWEKALWCMKHIY